MQYHLQYTRKYSVLVKINRSVIPVVLILIYTSVTSRSGTGEHSSSSEVAPYSIRNACFCSSQHSHFLVHKSHNMHEGG